MMILHRDHVVGGGLLAAAVAVLVLSGDLPFGTLGAPGPGMVPMLAIGLIALFATVLLAGARQSPVMAAITWPELPHAIGVIVAAALAALLYERLGFLLTMALMMFGLLAGLEKVPVWRATIYSLSVAIGAKLLLSTLLKSPLPTGPLGF